MRAGTVWCYLADLSPLGSFYQIPWVSNQEVLARPERAARPKSPAQALPRPHHIDLGGEWSTLVKSAESWLAEACSRKRLGQDARPGKGNHHAAIHQPAMLAGRILAPPTVKK